jgi:hypothetical protein
MATIAAGDCRQSTDCWCVPLTSPALDVAALMGNPAAGVYAVDGREALFENRRLNPWLTLRA